MTEIIIAQAHEVLRHFSLQKTADHIRHHYWWPCIGQDVEQYCKICPICQTMKSGTQKVPGLLHSLPIPTRPWEWIAMDFVGPFPESNGHDYLWVVICHLTSMVHLVPIRTTTVMIHPNFSHPFPSPLRPHLLQYMHQHQHQPYNQFQPSQ